MSHVMYIHDFNIYMQYVIFFFLIPHCIFHDEVITQSTIAFLSFLPFGRAILVSRLTITLVQSPLNIARDLFERL